MNFKRGKAINKADYDSKHVYRFFFKHTKLYPMGKKKHLAVSETQFKRVFKKFADRVIAEIIENYYWFKMPYGLGSLYIQSYKHNYKINEDTGKLKVRNNMIDIVKTRDLWNSDEEAKKEKKLVLKDYSNTDDIIYKIRWTRGNGNIVNNKFYAFKPSRAFKQKIYDACVDGTITSFN